MRFRLSLFLLVILLSVTLATTVLDNFFVNKQRENFIDRELDRAVATLIDTSLDKIRSTPDPSAADEVVSVALGDKRVGKFFILLDSEGKTIFETKSVKLLHVHDVPLTKLRFNDHFGGKMVRVLNQKLDAAHGGGLIQAGYSADEDLLFVPLLSLKDLVEVVGLTVLGMFFWMVLARKLLNPLRELSEKVSARASLSTSAARLPPIDVQVRSDISSAESHDEFVQLVTGLNALIDRVNRGYEVSRAWSFQMAHELKTPLAILTSDIEEAEEKGEIAPKSAETLRREIRFISETVSSFLLWAEVEGAAAQKDLHVMRIGSVVGSIVNRLQGHFESPLTVLAESDERVALSPAYLEIVLNNFISNAATYSEEKSEVKISSRGFLVEISNKGPRIPDEVLSHLGEPFNRGRVPGKDRRGHGLGLATVHSIARVLGWKIEFLRTGEWTTVRLDLGVSALESSPSLDAAPTVTRTV